MPTVSVIIPCFNAERYIAVAVESALAQDWHGSLEVVVVDDGSTDASADRVRELARSDPRVRLLQQANQGVAAARNHGLRCTSADWIAFLDADDFWLPGKLQAQWELLRSHPEARMCYTAWEVWPSDDPLPAGDYLAGLRAEVDTGTSWSGPSGWIYADLLLDAVVWTSTVVAHRSLLAEVGAFDCELRIGEDWDLWLRASRVTPILRVATPYALYRSHPLNTTRGAPAHNPQDVVISRALARWGYVSPDGSKACPGEVARRLARSWSNFAGANLRAGNLARARHGALQALRIDPRHFLGWSVLAKTMAPSLFVRTLRTGTGA